MDPTPLSPNPENWDRESADSYLTDYDLPELADFLRGNPCAPHPIFGARGGTLAGAAVTSAGAGGVNALAEASFATLEVTLAATEATFSMAETTFSMTDKTLSVAETTFSVTDKTFSVTETTFSVTDKTFSVADKTLSVAETTFSVTDKTVSVTDKTLSVAETTFSMTDKTVSVTDKTVSVPQNGPSNGETPVPRPETPASARRSTACPARTIISTTRPRPCHRHRSPGTAPPPAAPLLPLLKGLL